MDLKFVLNINSTLLEPLKNKVYRIAEPHFLRISLYAFFIFWGTMTKMTSPKIIMKDNLQFTSYVCLHLALIGLKQI